MHFVLHFANSYTCIAVFTGVFTDVKATELIDASVPPPHVIYKVCDPPCAARGAAAIRNATVSGTARLIAYYLAFQ